MTYDEEQAYNTSRAINDDKIETYSKEDKKDDDTSKEIQETLVKQRVAKTVQDIFMRIRFVAVIPKTQNKQIAVLE
jgi:hypothetical protein